MWLAHAFNPRTQEAKPSRYLRVQGQPGLHREFQPSWRYIVKPCYEKKKKKEEMSNCSLNNFLSIIPCSLFANSNWKKQTSRRGGVVKKLSTIDANNVKHCKIITFPSIGTDLQRDRLPIHLGRESGTHTPVSYTHLTLPTTTRV